MSANVLRGRPIAMRSNAARAEEGVWDQLACNKQPRTSLAGHLNAAQLRAAKALPGYPGRLPAPRQELSCLDGDLPPPLPEVVYPDFARGASPLPPNRPGGPPVNPPVGPGPNEPPSGGPGPGPAPPVGPPVGGGPEQPAPPCGCPPQEEPRMRYGYPRTIAFHLTGEVTSGASASELRFSQRIERPFIIRSIEVVPISGSAVGQFVDVLISDSDWPGDTSDPHGVSILTRQQGLADLPAEDLDIGLPVGTIPYDVPMAFEVCETSRCIVVQSRFQSPAVGLPQMHVVVVYEEFDSLARPIEPRPPLLPPPAPPLGPPSPESPPVPPVVAEPVPPHRPSTVGVCGPQRYAFGPVCPLPVYSHGSLRYSTASASSLSRQAALQATRFKGV